MYVPSNVQYKYHTLLCAVWIIISPQRLRRATCLSQFERLNQFEVLNFKLEYDIRILNIPSQPNRTSATHNPAMQGRANTRPIRYEYGVVHGVVQAQQHHCIARQPPSYKYDVIGRCSIPSHMECYVHVGFPFPTKPIAPPKHH